MSHYVNYYEDQVGTGGVIDQVYVGNSYQRGHGIGSFLGGLFRRALPLIRSGFRAVGKEALRTGLNVMGDVTTKNIDIKDALRSRMKESAGNLKNKAEKKIDELMSGRGYKSRKARGTRQSVTDSAHINKLKRTRNRVIRKKKNPKNKRKKKTQNKRKPQIRDKKNHNRKRKSLASDTKTSQKRSAYDIFDLR